MLEDFSSRGPNLPGQFPPSRMRPSAISVVRSLLSLAIAILGLGCWSCPTKPLSGPPPPPHVIQSPSTHANRSGTLKILTWNIWMMPDYIFQSPRNGQRAGIIASDLLMLDYDIICFEKAFSTTGRHALARALAKRYPYQYGPANSGWSLKMNSGVWIVSRFPLTDYHEIQFRASAGVESFARKGALMLTGTFQGHRFHLVAAHLQGETGSEYTEAHQRIREQQLMQIRDELLVRYTQPGLPIFLCGDFNTPRRDPKEPARDSAAYGAMLRILGNPQNGEGDRLTLEDACDRNDLAEENSGRSAELDYILIKPGSSQIDAQHSRLVFLHPGWDGRTLRQNLSYRHAVAVEATFH